MLTLPDAIAIVLFPFAARRHSPTRQKAQVLLAGTTLTPDQRTVAAALRVTGLSDDRNYALYHHLPSRAAWSLLGRPSFCSGVQRPKAHGCCLPYAACAGSDPD